MREFRRWKGRPDSRMSPYGYSTSSLHQWGGRYHCLSFVEEVPESGDVEGPARVPDLLSGPDGLRSKGHEGESFSVPLGSAQSLGDESTQNKHSHFRSCRKLLGTFIFTSFFWPICHCIPCHSRRGTVSHNHPDQPGMSRSS